MILSNNMKTIPSLKGQRLNSLSLILLAVTSLMISSCVVPYEQYTVQQEVQTSSKGTTVTKPVVINVQRSYYTPNYRYYTMPYYNCAPHYYRRNYYRGWGCYQSRGGPREKVALERAGSIERGRSRLLIYRGEPKGLREPWLYKFFSARERFPYIEISLVSI